MFLLHLWAFMACSRVNFTLFFILSRMFSLAFGGTRFKLKIFARFQTSAPVYMSSSLFWVFKQRILVVVYRPCFLKMEQIGYYVPLVQDYQRALINPLNPELNPICYLLALLGAHYFLYVSRIRVKILTFRRLMSYIYMEHPFLMFLDHTQRRSTVGRTPLDE